MFKKNIEYKIIIQIINAIQIHIIYISVFQTYVFCDMYIWVNYEIFYLMKYNYTNIRYIITFLNLLVYIVLRLTIQG